MNSNNTAMDATSYYDSISKHHDNTDSEDDSFASATSGNGAQECEMYNDVLFHAIIPEEEQISFSCSRVITTKGEGPNNGKRELFLTANRESYLSLRTAASSMGSSRLLSVGEMQSNIDDDLSYASFITEPDFDDRIVTVKFEEKDGRKVKIKCSQVPWQDDERFEQQVLSWEEVENFKEQEEVVNFNETSDGEEGYKEHHKSRRHNMCGRDSQNGGETFDMSGGINSKGILRSTTTPTLECSETSSLNNASFSSMSCGSSC